MIIEILSATMAFFFVIFMALSLGASTSRRHMTFWALFLAAFLNLSEDENAAV